MIMRLRNHGSFFQESFSNTTTRIHRVIAAALLMTLASCSGLPTATFSTTAGCGLAQWAEAWARENILSVTWDGICRDGLTQGNGTLVANMKSGNSMRFVGQMSNGKLKEGNFQRFDGWTLSGEFVDGFFYKGTILRPGGGQYYEGTMIMYQKLPGGGFIGYSDQRFDQGKLYLSDGSFVEDGRWDGSLGMYTLTLEAIKTARGVVWGKYYDANGVLQYRVVGGRRYADDTNYTLAKNEYLKREAAATEQANQAYMADLQRKEAEDRRQALGALAAGLGTPGSAANRLQAAQSALSSQSGPGASNTFASAPGAGNVCGASNPVITKATSNSPRMDTAQWPANSCGKVVIKTHTRGASYGFQNTCPCDIVLYYDLGNGVIDDMPLQANRVTSTDKSVVSGRRQPKEIGSCSRLPGGSYPGFRQESRTCSAYACQLNNSCGGSQTGGTAR